MAILSISGTVCGKGDNPAVEVRTFDNGDRLAQFSVADLQYVYTKKGTEREPQFYKVIARNILADRAAERLEKGDFVSVSGQLCQTQYNGQKYYEIRAYSIVDKTKKQNNEEESQEDIPF